MGENIYTVVVKSREKHAFGLVVVFLQVTKNTREREDLLD